MANGDNSLVTLVVVVVVILLIIWLVWAVTNNDNNGNGGGGNGGGNGNGWGRPDPVGGVTTELVQPGTVKICWDRPTNGVSFKVFINSCEGSCSSSSSSGGRPRPKPRGKRKKRRHHGGKKCNNPECCPVDCDSCVSQSNYEQVIETTDTCVLVDTCECICFIIVAYNRNGDASKCTREYFFDDCEVGPIQARVVKNDCNGVKIAWECGACCDVVKIWVNRQKVASVPCEEGEWSGPALGCDDVLSVLCKSRKCGKSDRVILINKTPTPHAHANKPNKERIVYAANAAEARRQFLASQ